MTTELATLRPAPPGEERVVWHHDGHRPLGLERRTHVQQEVEVYVAGCGPKVEEVHHQRLALPLFLAVDEGQRRLAAEGDVGLVAIHAVDE